MSKEAIIEKIISDANLRAEAAVGEAKSKANEIIADAAAECKTHYTRSLNEIDEAVKNIAARAETVAELDSRKLILAAKSEILDRAYALAYEKAKALPKAKYAALIMGMLELAEDGDEITISEREKSIVTKKAVEELAKRKGIHLTLNKEFGTFDGGIILSGKNVDKNLTLDVEFSVLRDETEARIARELLNE